MASGQQPKRPAISLDYKRLDVGQGLVCTGASASGNTFSPLAIQSVCEMIYIGPVTLSLPDGPLPEGAVLIDGCHIARVGAAVDIKPPPGSKSFFPPQSTLSPGFLDLQLNGAYGHDFTTSPESIWEVASRLPRHGITRFLPTVITSPPSSISRAIEVLRAGPPEGFQGARPLGLHLEGPFLNPLKKGAHPQDLFRTPDQEPEPSWLNAPQVQMVTLAPELPGAENLVRALSKRGVLVSAGHSVADEKTAHESFEWGISSGTHLYNAMSGLDHRTPGLVAALLETNRASAGLIADGVHVHSAMVRLAFRCKGPDGIYLVSDAMAAAGLGPGEHHLAGMQVVATESSVRLQDGTLAGSNQMLDANLQKLLAWNICSLQDALKTVTTTPAALLKQKSPEIVPGAVADLTVVDRQGRVLACFVDGKDLSNDGTKESETHGTS